MPGNHHSGRRRKPTALHVLAGTYRKDRHGDNATAPAIGGKAEKPADLTTGHAATFWDSHIEPLIAAGVVEAIDVAAARGMAELWGLYRAAADAAATNPTDQAARVAVTSYWAAFASIAARFGLNPSDRAKLQLPQAPRGGVPSRERVDKSKFFPIPAS